MIVPTIVPALLLGVVSSTLLAAVMHLTRGRTMRDLGVIWLAVSVGFWLTAIAAAWLRAPLYAIGELQLIAGLVGGLVAALIVTRK